MADILQLLRMKVDPARIVKASGAKGGEYHSPCPLCGGDDRFMVFPDQEGGELCQQHGLPLPSPFVAKMYFLVRRFKFFFKCLFHKVIGDKN